MRKTDAPLCYAYLNAFAAQYDDCKAKCFCKMCILHHKLLADMRMQCSQMFDAERYKPVRSALPLDMCT